MADKSYFVYHNGKFNQLQLEELAKSLSIPPEIRISTYSNEGLYEKIWSARLSTGLFGLTNCESGNSGPKGYSEIILAVGDEGLNKLVELGFITCPTCQPERIDGLWKAVQGIVEIKYGITTKEKFVDKSVLLFDARRVDWEEVLPVIGNLPNRLYVPKGLLDDDLALLNKRFADIGFALPTVGYYNHDVPDRFTPYQIPTF